MASTLHRTGMPLALICSLTPLCSWKIMSCVRLLLAHRQPLVPEPMLPEDTSWSCYLPPKLLWNFRCAPQVRWTFLHVCVMGLWWHYSPGWGHAKSFNNPSVVLVCDCHSTALCSLSLLLLTATQASCWKASRVSVAVSKGKITTDSDVGKWRKISRKWKSCVWNWWCS